MNVTAGTVLRLKPRHERRVRGGHAWVYSNEVDTAQTPLTAFAPGDLAELQDGGGKPMGTVYVNPHSLICARVLSRRTRVAVNTVFFGQRLERALAWREACFEQPFYRLVYGEGDGLPGLVVDRFGGVLVVQINTAGMEVRRADILDALEQVCRPDAIVLRNTGSARALEGLETYSTVARGQVSEPVPLEENGVAFLAPVLTGQKTGWFYDHRLARQRWMRYVGGRRVLDVFSYVGAWGIQALAAGAREAVLVDSSEPALAVAEENARRNGVGERCALLRGPALDVLRDLVARRERFDAVVVDPPAFIKRRKDQRRGEQGYRRVNELALRLLAPGGLLVSASCSRLLPRERLQALVGGAGRHVDRTVTLVEQQGLGPDHPVPAAMPEMDYLKSQWYRVTRTG